MDYVIMVSDGNTESMFLNYKEEQRKLRAHVSMVWQQATATLAAYDVFAEKLTPSGAGGDVGGKGKRYFTRIVRW